MPPVSNSDQRQPPLDIDTRVAVKDEWEAKKKGAGNRQGDTATRKSRRLTLLYEAFDATNTSSWYYWPASAVNRVYNPRPAGYFRYTVKDVPHWNIPAFKRAASANVGGPLQATTDTGTTGHPSDEESVDGAATNPSPVSMPGVEGADEWVRARSPNVEEQLLSAQPGQTSDRTGWDDMMRPVYADQYPLQECDLFGGVPGA